MDYIFGSNTTTTNVNMTEPSPANDTSVPERPTFGVIIGTTPASILYTELNLTEIFGPPRDPLYIVIPITFIYMAIFITGVVGNISTCIVISKNRTMHTATNYYLFSLAVSDFLLLIAGVPQEMYMIWSKYPYVFGETFCVLRGLMAEASANATVLTITAFTVERYVAICYPFLSHTMSKLSRAIRLIVCVWVLSIILAIPQALQFGVMSVAGQAQCAVTRVIIEHSFELSTFVFFVGPMVLITVLYVMIGLKLRSASLMPRANGATLQRRAPQSSSLRQQTGQGTRRVLRMLVAVVVAFFLCWAPFHAQRLVAIYGSGHDHLTIYVVMTYISGILYYLSTCINPLLYNLMSNKFREAFKETLASCCRTAARADDEKRSYRVLSRGQRTRTGRLESTDYSVMTAVTGFAGSSLRDESLYSTTTQKQSFESMTPALASAATHINGGNYAKRVSFDNSASNGAAAAAATAVAGVSTAAAAAAAHRERDREQPGSATDPNTAAQLCGGHQCVDLNGGGGVRFHRTADHVRISLTALGDAANGNAVATIRAAARPTRVRQLLRRLQFWRWRLHHVRAGKHIGYYSPPMDQHRLAPTAAAARKRKFYVEFEDTLLETLESSLNEQPVAPVMGGTRNAPDVVLASTTGAQFSTEVLASGSITVGVGGDSEVQCDELSAYMAELRQRELS